MPTVSPSYQRFLDGHRRQLIVDAARRVFEEDGLENASMRGIALAAGCTTGAIYPHFNSKEDLFAAVLGESLSILRQEVLRAMQGLPPAKALRRGTKAIFKHYDEHPSSLTLALVTPKGDRRNKLGRGLDRALKDQFDLLIEVLARPLAELADKPFLPMARLEATALVTYLIGLLVLKHGGRIDTIGNRAPALLAHYTSRMIGRLATA